MCLPVPGSLRKLLTIARHGPLDICRVMIMYRKLWTEGLRLSLYSKAEYARLRILSHLPLRDVIYLRQHLIALRGKAVWIHVLYGLS